MYLYYHAHCSELVVPLLNLGQTSGAYAFFPAIQRNCCSTPHSNSGIGDRTTDGICIIVSQQPNSLTDTFAVHAHVKDPRKKKKVRAKAGDNKEQ